MAIRRDTAEARPAAGRLACALLAGAALLVGVPTASFAVVISADSAPLAAPMMRFTPANVDPAAARRVAASIAARGQSVRFTPAATGSAAPRMLTVAIRVDGHIARAISVRDAIETSRTAPAAPSGTGTGLAALAPARFNVGIARGYRSFAEPPAPATPAGLGIESVALPDLASFRPREGAKDKPSRFQGSLALESEARPGRSPRTLEGIGGQAVDLSTGYRVSKSLNVTAGVRLTQDRDRLAPLTDTVRDDQAVYVGTRFRF